MEKIKKDLQQKFPEKIRKMYSDYGDDVLVIQKDALMDILQYLKKSPYDYTMLLDLTCVDYMREEPRFEMVYHLLSLSNRHRLRIKTRLPEKDLSIQSLTPIWKNANWLEREVFDMFGIQFKNHPDLRRIFMYDGFEGFPLRKDYPLRKRQPRIPLKE
ncbi:NADH-quinone oxidoreductase subunit C [bacterium]|nr:NADH-quinone oxidoreductase subunit C [bacterium]